MFFFFKQKTAYEMRISDWSSDVCSSDLIKHRELTVLPVSARFGGPISFSGNGDRIFFVMHTSSRFGAKLASVSIDRFDVRESGIQIGSPNTRIEAAVVSPSGKAAAIPKLGNPYPIRCSPRSEERSARQEVFNTW